MMSQHGNKLKINKINNSTVTITNRNFLETHKTDFQDSNNFQE